jgi:Cu/Ag efflux protein CusF
VRRNVGYASTLCHANLLEQQQQELSQALHQVRQTQQDLQQRTIHDQQMRNLGFPNETLRKQIERDTSMDHLSEADLAKGVFESWQSQNPWFGSNKAKTQFAMQNAEQLRRDQPDLIGREFFNVAPALLQENCYRLG